jgi:hypothetical protein
MLVRVKSGNTTFDDEKLIQLLLAGATEEENFRMEMKDKRIANYGFHEKH